LFREAPLGTIGAASKSGRIDSGLLLQWFEHFVKRVKNHSRSITVKHVKPLCCTTLGNASAITRSLHCSKQHTFQRPVPTKVKQDSSPGALSLTSQRRCGVKAGGMMPT